MKGILSKNAAAKGEDKVRGSWQDRWFELKEEVLYYYMKKGDALPKGHIPLRGAKVSIGDQRTGKSNSIRIAQAKPIFNYLQCKSKIQFTKWMRALRVASGEEENDGNESKNLQDRRTSRVFGHSAASLVKKKNTLGHRYFVTVTSQTRTDLNSKIHVWYRLEIQGTRDQDLPWSIDTRFRELKQLAKAIKSSFPSSVSHFPKKKGWLASASRKMGINKVGSDANSRCYSLQRFWESLMDEIRACESQGTEQIQWVYEFLGVNDYERMLQIEMEELGSKEDNSLLNRIFPENEDELTVAEVFSAPESGVEYARIVDPEVLRITEVAIATRTTWFLNEYFTEISPYTLVAAMKSVFLNRSSPIIPSSHYHLIMKEARFKRTAKERKALEPVLCRLNPRKYEILKRLCDMCACMAHGQSDLKFLSYVFVSGVLSPKEIEKETAVEVLKNVMLYFDEAMRRERRLRKEREEKQKQYEAQRSEARTMLSKAIVKREVDTLVKAIDNANSINLHKTEAALLCAKKILADLQGYHKKLRSAVFSRSLGALQAAMELAAEMGLGGSIEATTVDFYKHLQDEGQIVQALRVALDGKQNDMLKNALARAQQFEVQTMLDRKRLTTKLVKLGYSLQHPLVPRAVDYMAAEEKKSAQIALVQIAIKKRDWEFLSNLVQKLQDKGAASLSAIPRPQLEEAESLFAQYSICRENVKRAVRRRDMKELEESLETAKKLNIEVDIIEDGEKQLSNIQEEQKITSDLERAIAHKEDLEEAIASAENFRRTSTKSFRVENEPEPISSPFASSPLLSKAREIFKEPDDEAKKAQREEEEKLRQLEAKRTRLLDELHYAMNKKELLELENAVKSCQEMKLGDDLNVIESLDAAKSLMKNIKTYHKRLITIITSRDMKALDDIMDTAAEMGIDGPIEACTVEFKRHLQEETLIIEALKRALEAKELETMRATLIRMRRLKTLTMVTKEGTLCIELISSSQAVNEHDNLIQKTKKAIADEEKRQKQISNIRSAIDNLNWKLLRTVDEEKSKDFSMVPEKFIKEATDLVAQYTKCQKSINGAIKTRDGKCLRELIEQGRQLRLEKYLLDLATSYLDNIETEKGVFMTLESAIRTKNGLKEAISSAKGFKRLQMGTDGQPSKTAAFTSSSELVLKAEKIISDRLIAEKIIEDEEKADIATTSTPKSQSMPRIKVTVNEDQTHLEDSLSSATSTSSIPDQKAVSTPSLPSIPEENKQKKDIDRAKSDPTSTKDSGTSNDEAKTFDENKKEKVTKKFDSLSPTSSSLHRQNSAPHLRNNSSSSVRSNVSHVSVAQEIRLRKQNKARLTAASGITPPISPSSVTGQGNNPLRDGILSIPGSPRSHASATSATSYDSTLIKLLAEGKHFDPRLRKNAEKVARYTKMFQVSLQKRDLRNLRRVTSMGTALGLEGTLQVAAIRLRDHLEEEEELYQELEGVVECEHIDEVEEVVKRIEEHKPLKFQDGKLVYAPDISFRGEMMLSIAKKQLQSNRRKFEADNRAERAIILSNTLTLTMMLGVPSIDKVAIQNRLDYLEGIKSNVIKAMKTGNPAVLDRACMEVSELGEAHFKLKSISRQYLYSLVAEHKIRLKIQRALFTGNFVQIIDAIRLMQNFQCMTHTGDGDGGRLVGKGFLIDEPNRQITDIMRLRKHVANQTEIRQLLEAAAEMNDLPVLRAGIKGANKLNMAAAECVKNAHHTMENYELLRFALHEALKTGEYSNVKDAVDTMNQIHPYWSEATEQKLMLRFDAMKKLKRASEHVKIMAESKNKGILGLKISISYVENLKKEFSDLLGLSFLNNILPSSVIEQAKKEVRSMETLALAKILGGIKNTDSKTNSDLRSKVKLLWESVSNRNLVSLTMTIASGKKSSLASLALWKKALETKNDIGRCKDNMKNALMSRDVDMIKKALLVAEKLQIFSSLEKNAMLYLRHLQAENNLCKQLEIALKCKSLTVLQRIASKLSTFRRLHYENGKLIAAGNYNGKLLEDARRVARTLLARKKLISNLEVALISNDTKIMERMIQLCLKSESVRKSPLTVYAKTLLLDMKECNEELKAALSSRDYAKVRAAHSKAAELGINNTDSKAVSLYLSHLEDQHFLEQNLIIAMRTRNSKKLSDILIRCKSFGQKTVEEGNLVSSGKTGVDIKLETKGTKLKTYLDMRKKILNRLSEATAKRDQKRLEKFLRRADKLQVPNGFELKTEVPENKGRGRAVSSVLDDPIVATANETLKSIRAKSTNHRRKKKKRMKSLNSFWSTIGNSASKKSLASIMAQSAPKE
mmetsp:Transcript_18626/g.27870  ORF Transcript_18626/g.27870 Transcript_18626/m.27870 type:complete len:2288 (+) Transcript_18626:36-6899(+)|eukprot:CAMPEP_0167764052 /NCGR_PEP_ID=MMETSP0110_2-20121227/13780_1 /TAXON_ID=629695 /ORGANISM="Gymnochlora sp., Strain CCMP2014" /LENGTH=2287 /DNA_ID=CAMNT_0007651337 /DNA_START=23 /DNA_END=6886 /DNA_ORIENTATION=-